MKIEYSSNNSGGKWWLTDEDWLALEKAGWKVTVLFGDEPTRATKEFKSIKKAKKEFAVITGQDPDAVGCRCCGKPHEFYEVRD